MNGDALAEKLSLEGEVIICRECLINGPVRANDLNTFWKERAQHLCSDANDQEYYSKILVEFERSKIFNESEINLWFEHDLSARQIFGSPSISS